MAGSVIHAVTGMVGGEQVKIGQKMRMIGIHCRTDY